MKPPAWPFLSQLAINRLALKSLRILPIEFSLAVRQTVRLGVAIDLGKRCFRKRDVDPHRAGCLLAQRDQNGDAVAIVRIGHDLLEGSRFRDRLAVLRHAFDVEGKRFLGVGARLVEGRARGDATGKIWKRDREFAESRRGGKRQNELEVGRTAGNG